MNWNIFWSGLLGTTIPAFLVSLLILYLNHRTNLAMEQYKSASSRDLSDRALWHERRVNSLLAIHDSFRQCLNFFRRELYVKPSEGLDMTSLHDFLDSIQENLVYLNDDLRQTILKYRQQFLEFWNWATLLRVDDGSDDWKQVQKRLDFEMPAYLEKLRQIINTYADPTYYKE